MARRGGAGGVAPKRTPLRSKTPLYSKREQEKNSSTGRQPSRSASSLAKPAVKNNGNTSQREKANQSTPGAVPNTKPSLTSSLFGGMLGSMLPMFLFMNWFRKDPERDSETVEDTAQKKCQKLACNIQDCLEKNDYQQSMCEEAIRKYHACMEAAKGNYENL